MQTQPENASTTPATADLQASPEDAGTRLDQFLSDAFPHISRAFIQRCIRDGLVLRNGELARKADRLHAGDRLQVEWPPDESHELTAEAIPLDIVYEDDDVLVVNKPPDLVIHPNAKCTNGTLVHALLYHNEDAFREMVDETLRPGIVHRLDKDTSGLVVVAKTMDARNALKESFKAHDVEKTYLTIVRGEFGAATGTIRTLIGRHPYHRTKMAVVEEDGKHAVTHYRLLGTTPEASLLQVRIETGRTHQIRVHFAHLRHPVLGDVVYGGKASDLGVEVPRQMLHAWKLVFPHPRTGIKRQYVSPPPDDFRRVAAALGLPVVGEGPQPHPPDISSDTRLELDA